MVLPALFFVYFRWNLAGIRWLNQILALCEYAILKSSTLIGWCRSLDLFQSVRVPYIKEILC